MADELQFDRADYGDAAAAGSPCASCKTALRDRYFEINGKRVCATCRAKIGSWPPATPGKRFGRALLYGAGWAFVGFVVYYMVAKLLHIELGIVAIFIGFYVGRGVRTGSYGVGGAGYQALAMALTYLSVAGVYYAFILEAIADKGSLTPLSCFVAVPFAIAAPFLGGVKNILSILIIGFGLYQAWKVNKRFVLAIAGPFELKPPELAVEPAPAPAPAAAPEQDAE